MHRCPANGREYGAVGLKTIQQQLDQPWNKELHDQAYYFCTDADCDVVYFGQDDSVISKTELRSSVGIKQSTPDRTICYCFGVSHESAANNPSIRDFVIQQTRLFRCSCETRNPSGRCCLKDFPGQ